MTAAENTEKTPMDGAPEIDFDRFRPTRSATDEAIRSACERLTA